MTDGVVVVLASLASLVLAQTPTPAPAADAEPVLQRPKGPGAPTPLDEEDGLPVLPPSLRDGPPSAIELARQPAPEPEPVPQVLVDVPLSMPDAPPQLPPRSTLADQLEWKRKRKVYRDTTIAGGALLAGGVTIAIASSASMPSSRVGAWQAFQVSMVGTAITGVGFLTFTIGGIKALQHRRRMPVDLVDPPRYGWVDRQVHADHYALRRDRSLLGVTLTGVGLLAVGSTAMWMPWAVGAARTTLNPPPCQSSAEGCFDEPYVEFGFMIGGSALVGAGTLTAAIAGTMLKRHRQRHGLGKWAGTIRPTVGGLSMTF